MDSRVSSLTENQNKFVMFDNPLDYYRMGETWRGSLYTFLSSKFFHYIESREMISGAEAIYRLLSNLDIQKDLENTLSKWNSLSDYTPIKDDYKDVDDIREDINLIDKSFDAFIVSQKIALKRRINLIKQIDIEKNNPAWMVLFNLPVLPPDLRPIMKLKDGQIILSDLNELYRMILTRNLAIAELSIESMHTITAIAQKILLQQAVDALLGNGIGNTIQDLENHPYKSIPDILSGKEGRFRENLLGKRVDYSGRSVIVVGPSLKLYQCGLPKDMAVELFQPFIIRSLILNSLAHNTRSAKKMIYKRLPIIWKILREVIKNHYIILNRAPTLHRLGIQAFQPVLVEERAIKLHPLVCTGFNADFDGDQMAVHVPLSLEAQAEAYMLMCPYFNLISSATGDPITVPSQDMLLGIYILTLETHLGIAKFINKPNNNDLQFQKYTIPILQDSQSIYKHKDMKTDAIIWLASTSFMIVTNNSIPQIPIEKQYDSEGNVCNIYEYAVIFLDKNMEVCKKYMRTTFGRLLLNQYIEQAIHDTEYVYHKDRLPYN